jgi:hypothetical protein
VAKIFSGLLVAACVLCLICASILALTVGSLDLQIFDYYFVVLPGYLILLSACLLVAAFVVWKTTAT